MNNMNEKQMFRYLVKNAIDFLSKSLSEIQKQPKYSMIHFYAAVELLIKARLMKEHWSLIVTGKQEPDWNKFIVGNFQSVSIHDAANRHKNIVRSGLSDVEIKEFRNIANHRNKMIHFFHEFHTAKESNALRNSIVKHQLNAWYSLHKILTIRWKNEFSSWQKKIKDINDKLLKLREFLQAIYDKVKPEIDILKEKGIKFTECPSCGFEAQKHDGVPCIKYTSKCCVCEHIESILKIECPECNKMIIFRNEGFGVCHSCGKSFKPENLIDVLQDETAAHFAAHEGDDTWDLGNCHWCDGYETVTYTTHGKWICANCLEVFDSLDKCEWCGEKSTADMQDSYTFGCSYCKGRIGKDD